MPGVPLAEKAPRFHCPECEQLLEPTNYEGASGIIIDACANDHGFWLEGGEMGQLQIYSAYLSNTEEAQTEADLV